MARCLAAVRGHFDTDTPRIPDPKGRTVSKGAPDGERRRPALASAVHTFCP